MNIKDFKNVIYYLNYTIIVNNKNNNSLYH